MGNLVDGYVRIERPGDPSKNLNNVKMASVKVSNKISKKGGKKDLNSRLKKILEARVISKELTKDKVSVDLKAITSQPVYSRDKNRFFNGTFEAEKRSLFFE